jgi:hypothetical protein
MPMKQHLAGIGAVVPKGRPRAAMRVQGTRRWRARILGRLAGTWAKMFDCLAT